MKSVTLKMKIPNAAECLLLSLSLLLCGSSVQVQVAANKLEEKRKDDVLMLSPFEISEKLTVGYLANDTLAGTRINTKLKDVANSVQVLTKEFLEDTGATSGSICSSTPPPPRWVASGETPPSIAWTRRRSATSSPDSGCAWARSCGGPCARATS